MTDPELLPEEALERLGSLVEAVNRAEAADLDYHGTARIHFLRNFTIEPIDPYLKFHLLRERIRPELTFGGYGTEVQEVLQEDSILRSTQPDIAVLAVMLENLDRDYGRHGWRADDALTQLQNTVELLLERTSTLVVVNTLLPPFYGLEGPAIANGRTDTDGEVRRLNDHLRGAAADNPGRLALIDWERLMRTCGRDAALDARFWRLSQAPFKKSFLDLYAREIAKITRALMGRSKKCLVLDCDNTLWGGVVGEDGIDGLQLDPSEWPGAAFHEFQRTVLGLHERGVLIALSSKNNEDDVWEVLDRHPHCLLDRSHLAAWRIDWGNKAANIEAIADELNIGIDSLVFVDDSPQERALVSQALPDVTVLDVPSALDEYPNLLLEAGLFDTLSVSSEDRQRGQMYRDEKKRREKRQSFSDITSYLASLETVARLRVDGSNDLARIAQLTQKTNQFNLTTRRYSEGAIRERASDAGAAVFGIEVEDRYGKMGVSGALIALRQNDVGVVDTLLLSCRVLGRELEYALVDQCMTALEKRWALTEWRAEYIPTKKNVQVADFWDRIGFNVLAEKDGCKQYSMPAGQRSSTDRPRAYRNVVSVEWE